MELKPQLQQEGGKERKKNICGCAYVNVTKKKAEGEWKTTQKHPAAIQLFNFGGGEREGRSQWVKGSSSSVID